MWNYYRDEPINPLSSNSESFKYKTSITGNTYNLDVGDAGYDATKVGKNETEVVIPIKHLSNFWSSLNIPLTNFEIELILTWSKNCILADMIAANNAPTELEFQITDTKLYVPAVTLSKENDKKAFRTINTQQTFVGLQGVLKTSSRQVLKTSSTHLQRNSFTSSKTSSTSWRRFQDLSQDVFKTSSRRLGR